MDKIKKLAEMIKKQGFVYKLIDRTDDKCMYQQMVGERTVAYEVFRTKLVDAKKAKAHFDKLKGVVDDTPSEFDFSESFPRDEEFGSRAWTYRTFDQAKLCYDGL